MGKHHCKTNGERDQPDEKEQRRVAHHLGGHFDKRLPMQNYRKRKRNGKQPN
jgi:hypothetical protein